jgi:hypothetical protein
MQYITARRSNQLGWEIRGQFSLGADLFVRQDITAEGAKHAKIVATQPLCPNIFIGQPVGAKTVDSR